MQKHSGTLKTDKLYHLYRSLPTNIKSSISPFEFEYIYDLGFKSAIEHLSAKNRICYKSKCDMRTF